MVLIIYRPDGSVAVRKRILDHSSVQRELAVAYYNLHLTCPDYEVVQA